MAMTYDDGVVVVVVVRVFVAVTYRAFSLPCKTGVVDAGASKMTWKSISKGKGRGWDAFACSLLCIE